MLIFLEIKVSLWKRDRNIDWGKVRKNAVILYMFLRSVHWKGLEAVLNSSIEHISCPDFHF